MDIQRMIAREAAKVAVRRIMGGKAHKASINHQDGTVLQSHKPSFYTEVGLRRAYLHKLDVSPNGRTIAYYDIDYWSPSQRRMVKRRFLYNVVHGEPRLVKQFNH